MSQEKVREDQEMGKGVFIGNRHEDCGNQLKRTSFLVKIKNV